jgi:hypothetical protein
MKVGMTLWISVVAVNSPQSIVLPVSPSAACYGWIRIGWVDGHVWHAIDHTPSRRISWWICLGGGPRDMLLLSNLRSRPSLRTGVGRPVVGLCDSRLDRDRYESGGEGSSCLRVPLRPWWMKEQV